MNARIQVGQIERADTGQGEGFTPDRIVHRVDAGVAVGGFVGRRVEGRTAEDQPPIVGGDDVLDTLVKGLRISGIVQFSVTGVQHPVARGCIVFDQPSETVVDIGYVEKLAILALFDVEDVARRQVADHKVGPDRVAVVAYLDDSLHGRLIDVQEIPATVESRNKLTNEGKISGGQVGFVRQGTVRIYL